MCEANPAIVRTYNIAKAMHLLGMYPFAAGRFNPRTLENWIPAFAEMTISLLLSLLRNKKIYMR